MLRKMILRAIYASVAVVSILVTATVVAGYLALQPPAYYAALRQEYPAADVAAAKRHWEKVEMDFRLWLETSIARQQGNRVGPEPAAAAGGVYDPAQDVYTVRITEQQINARIAADGKLSMGDISDPRIRLAQDHIELAAELNTGDTNCVLSVALKPTSTDNGALRLDIQSMRVGRLPVPLGTILSCLPHDIVKSDRHVELTLTPAAPHIVLKLGDARGQIATIKSIRVLPGQMFVEFVPPVIVSEPEELAAL